MGADRAVAAGQAAASAPFRPAATGRPWLPAGHPVRAAHRDPVGVAAAGARLRVRDDVLTPAAGLARGRGVGPAAPGAADPVAPCREAGLVPGGDRRLPPPGPSGLPKTGPSPVDRARPGPTYHVNTDAGCTPARHHPDRWQPPRHHPAAAPARRDPADPRSDRSPPSPAAAVVRRPGLRLRQVPSAPVEARSVDFPGEPPAGAVGLDGPGRFPDRELVAKTSRVVGKGLKAAGKPRQKRTTAEKGLGWFGLAWEGSGYVAFPARLSPVGYGGPWVGCARKGSNAAARS